MMGPRYLVCGVREMSKSAERMHEMMDDFQGHRFVACRLEKGHGAQAIIPHLPWRHLASSTLFFFLFLRVPLALLRKWAE